MMDDPIRRYSLQERGRYVGRRAATLSNPELISSLSTIPAESLEHIPGAVADTSRPGPPLRKYSLEEYRQVTPVNSGTHHQHQPVYTMSYPVHMAAPGLTRAELAGQGIARAELGGQVMSTSELVAPGYARPEFVGPGIARPEYGGQGMARPELVGPGMARPIQEVQPFYMDRSQPGVFQQQYYLERSPPGASQSLQFQAMRRRHILRSQSQGQSYEGQGQEYVGQGQLQGPIYVDQPDSLMSEGQMSQPGSRPQSRQTMCLGQGQENVGQQLQGSMVMEHIEGQTLQPGSRPQSRQEQTMFIDQGQGNVGQQLQRQMYVEQSDGLMSEGQVSQPGSRPQSRQGQTMYLGQGQENVGQQLQGLMLMEQPEGQISQPGSRPQSRQLQSQMYAEKPDLLVPEGQISLSGSRPQSRQGQTMNIGQDQGNVGQQLQRQMYADQHDLLVPEGQISQPGSRPQSRQGQTMLVGQGQENVGQQFQSRQGQTMPSMLSYQQIESSQSYGGAPQQLVTMNSHMDSNMSMSAMSPIQMVQPVQQFQQLAPNGSAQMVPVQTMAGARFGYRAGSLEDEVFLGYQPVDMAYRDKKEGGPELEHARKQLSGSYGNLQEPYEGIRRASTPVGENSALVQQQYGPNYNQENCIGIKRSSINSGENSALAAQQYSPIYNQENCVEMKRPSTPQGENSSFVQQQYASYVNTENCVGMQTSFTPIRKNSASPTTQQYSPNYNQDPYVGMQKSTSYSGERSAYGGIQKSPSSAKESSLASANQSPPKPHRKKKVSFEDELPAFHRERSYSSPPDRHPQSQPVTDIEPYVPLKRAAPQKTSPLADKTNERKHIDTDSCNPDDTYVGLRRLPRARSGAVRSAREKRDAAEQEEVMDNGGQSSHHTLQKQDSSDDIKNMGDSEGIMGRHKGDYSSETKESVDECNNKVVVDKKGDNSSEREDFVGEFKVVLTPRKGDYAGDKGEVGSPAGMRRISVPARMRGQGAGGGVVKPEKTRRNSFCPMTAYNLRGSSTVAIDNKIEQAMDLVKSHLMFAVREEVEVLKEQIAELIERNNQLEYENGILRAAATPETLAKLAQPRQQPPSSSS